VSKSFDLRLTKGDRVFSWFVQSLQLTLAIQFLCKSISKAAKRYAITETNFSMYSCVTNLLGWKRFCETILKAATAIEAALKGVLTINQEGFY